jgi:hypothetical protein
MTFATPLGISTFMHTPLPYRRLQTAAWEINICKPPWEINICKPPWEINICKPPWEVDVKNLPPFWEALAFKNKQTQNSLPYQLLQPPLAHQLLQPPTAFQLCTIPHLPNSLFKLPWQIIVRNAPLARRLLQTLSVNQLVADIEGRRF